MRLLNRLFLLALLLFAGLPPASAQQRPPLVLAAASLQESLTAAADAWTRAGHRRPVLSFAASSALARQIDAGAAADIFISADEPWMDHVAQQRLIRPGTRVTLLANRLVLVAPANSLVRLDIRRGFPIARALGRGWLAMADPDAVPAGKYGKAALANLGVWPEIAGRVARAENVRAALALVERGEAPLGIVYETDARATKRVRVVGYFPEGSHPPITYPMAILARSTSPDAAGFHAFLRSRGGRAIFARYGFRGR